MQLLAQIVGSKVYAMELEKMPSQLEVAGIFRY
ncbi:hypothetical protein Nos7107_0322 [Nostoc sp. PCC 7107]|nr:hypothetical protein Nos7107_0322 [Nostoc sp. PCC 7107]